MCEDGVPCEGVEWESLELDISPPDDEQMMNIIFVNKADHAQIMLPAFSQTQALLAMLEGQQGLFATRDDGKQWPFLPIDWVEKHHPDISEELQLLRRSVREHMLKEHPVEGADDPHRGDG